MSLPQLPEFTAGDTPTLLDAEQANKIRKALQIINSCIGIQWADHGSTIDLKYLQDQFEAWLDAVDLGIPTGFSEETISICDSGTPTDRIFLTKDPP